MWLLHVAVLLWAQQRPCLELVGCAGIFMISLPRESLEFKNELTLSNLIVICPIMLLPWASFQPTLEV